MVSNKDVLKLKMVVWYCNVKVTKLCMKWYKEMLVGKIFGNRLVVECLLNTAQIPLVITILHGFPFIVLFLTTA